VGITNEDGNVSEDYINEEVGTLGKTLTETERDEMRQHFEGITFDSISPYYPLPQHLVIPFRLNNITIDFNAIETGKPNLVNYRYILEGYDKGWSPVMKNKSATFGNIADGTYIFKVKAQAPNGLWCLPVTYMFKVLPPWYRTWWFLFLEAITVISLVLWAIKLYTARKLAQQKREIENLLAISNERARIASDMHDDLGAGLTAIGLLSGLANLKINLDHPAKTEIEKIEKSAGNLAENLREIIWTMNTRFDKLDDFIVYVRAFSVEYFEESDMNFKFESPSQLPDIGMQGDLRRNLFLCIKEALHNIIKHSKASNARLSFTIDTSDGNSSQFTLVIEIKDDGIGIAGTNINKFGNGLKNMNERITKFGGRLDIDVNNGTRLLFRVIIK
jgi:signal transduction histidine kinase